MRACCTTQRTSIRARSVQMHTQTQAHEHHSNEPIVALLWQGRADAEQLEQPSNNLSPWSKSVVYGRVS